MLDELSTPYALTADHIESYRKNGYVKLKNVLSAGTLDHYGAEITRLVHALNKQNLPVKERNTYGQAFLQIGNLWEHSEVAKTFCMSKRLGRIAAELMGVDGVRMYHDQALFKEPSGGFTPWHADQFYWPLSNNNSITAWIPLQAVPVEMGPLSFCIGSQTILDNRDLAISDDSEEKIGRSLKDYPKDESPFDLGEVSFHSGWTFHRAGPNSTDQMRSVMTIIYIEDGMRVGQPKNSNQENDKQNFFPGTKVGDIAATPKNPLIYSSNAKP